MTAATDDVTTTDVNWGPAFRAEVRRVSLPFTAGTIIFSNVSIEESIGDAVWKIPSTPVGC
jgi:hypothetical protein